MVCYDIEENKAIGRRWFDSASLQDELSRARQAGNPPSATEEVIRSRVSEVFSPDVVMHFPDGDGQVDRIVRYHLTTLEAFPDASFIIDDLVAEGDKVVVRGRMQGTNTGPFMGRPPTGHRVEMEYITICRIAGGKIVESGGCNNMAGFLRQLDISPG